MADKTKSWNDVIQEMNAERAKYDVSPTPNLSPVIDLSQPVYFTRDLSIPKSDDQLISELTKETYDKLKITQDPHDTNRFIFMIIEDTIKHLVTTKRIM